VKLKNSLAKKPVLFIFISFLFFIFVTSFGIYFLGYKEIFKKVEMELKISGQQAVNSFLIIREKAKQMALNLSNIVSMLETDDKKTIEILSKLIVNEYVVSYGVWPLAYQLNKNKYNNSLFFVRNKKNFQVTLTREYDKKGYMNEKWFKKGLTLKKNQVAWSNIYTDKITGVKMITIIAPVYKKDKLIAVSTIDLEANVFERIFLKEIDEALPNYAFLVSKENELVVYNDLEVAKKWKILKQNLSQKISKATSIKNAKLYIFDIKKDPIFNTHSYGVCFDIKQTDLKVIIVVPFHQAFKGVERIIYELITVLILLSIFTVVIIYIMLNKYLIKPLYQVSKELEISDKFDLKAAPLIHYQNLHDEIGMLVSKLNERNQIVKDLYKEIEETQKEVVFTMGAIGESRSKETGNHVKRVAEYSKILALHYGLSKEEVEILKEASPMHDIGKIAIPDAILKKPGRLNEEEFKTMQKHAKLGYEMLKYSKRELLQTAAIVAYQHHEKWDGSGYPRGLKGEEIHIYGRITALADVFDALGSDRVYKKAWEDEKIFQYFKEQKAKHFDPVLVDIFFQHLEEFLQAREKFKDKV
jgi:response regulator RpfG family c-di-GMP phosphodiesterase